MGMLNVHSILNAPPKAQKPVKAYLVRGCQKRICFGHMRGQPLTLYEREKIQFLLKGKWGVRRIARCLHRDHSVIVRELQRNSCRDGVYRARKAHERAERRRNKPHKRKLDEDNILRNWMVKRLRDGWSPEQISGRLKNRPDPYMRGRYICAESIYQYIYQGDGRFMGLYQYLPRQHKKRRRYKGRKHRKDKGIQFITPIAFRPKEVDEKQAFGHWESDSMVFSDHRPGLSVQRERVSHYTFIRKIENMRAKTTEEALRYHIEIQAQGIFKSITFDRGSEGANHYKLRIDYDIDTYHCDPYCSWQKGAVENTNKLIRRYLPRNRNPITITDQEIYAIQERLNNRPRKSLNYKTPRELFEEFTRREVVH